MKKWYLTLLSFALTLCLSLSLEAQSDDAELNQVKLMEQFIGSWNCTIGEDTVIELKIIPFGKALNLYREVKVRDEILMAYTGIYGLSQDGKTVITAGAAKDGSLTLDYGRFVSSTKFVAEMYFDNMMNPLAIEEVEFQSPDSFTVRSKYRGDEMTWDVLWSPVWTFTRQQ